VGGNTKPTQVTRIEGTTVQSLASLTEARISRPCVFLLGNTLFATGGGPKGNALKTMEKLDLSNNQATWQPSVKLYHARRYTACVTVNNMAYIVAGKYIKPSNTLYSWRNGDPRWIQLKSMRYNRYAHCAVSDGRYIYAIGGRSYRILSKVERYDMHQHKGWKELKDMLVPLVDHQCVYISGTIIVLGGVTPTGITDAIYLYFIHNNTWALSPTSLQKPTAYHTVAVVDA